MTTLRILIVDDEPVARTGIRVFLEDEPGVVIIGECANGEEAVAAIRKQDPDLVFLDVQMPGLGGFDVIEEIGPEQMPAVVFVTAYDQHALRAFEAHAIDYLLKPFNRERLLRAYQRARHHIQGQQIDQVRHTLFALLKDHQQITAPAPTYTERLVIKSAGYVFFLNVAEVDWIEAAGNYMKLHVGEKVHLLRETMNGLEAQLDPSRFLRIRRSVMVNIERIRRLRTLANGEYEVLLQTGMGLTSSRRYRKKLRVLFKAPS